MSPEATVEVTARDRMCHALVVTFGISAQVGITGRLAYKFVDKVKSGKRSIVLCFTKDPFTLRENEK